MRRIIFYLLIVSATFGAGSLIAVNDFWNTDKAAPIQITDKIFPVNEKRPPIVLGIIPPKSRILDDFRKQAAEDRKTAPPYKVNFKCEDKHLSVVWDLLRKGKVFRENSDERIEKDHIGNCSELFQVDQLIDLNNDGINEAIVSGRDYLVNGAQNKAIWIVQKSGKTYKIILYDSAEDYEIMNHLTNGFRDFFVKHHMSAYSSYQTIYVFSQGKYRENKCFFVDYGTTGKKVVATCAEENKEFPKLSGRTVTADLALTVTVK